jgi:hypothetical protein
MTPDPLQWLLESDEPWTRYRALVDLLDRPADDAEVQSARAEMLAHPQVQELIAQVSDWPGYALQRHNDAKHPLQKFSVLADFGLRADDAGMDAAIEAVMAHRSPEGALQSLVNVPKAFGGSGEDAWTWMLCDAPTLLYALLALGLGDDQRVQRAAEHLAGLVDENGWRCVVAPELGKFKGPGRKADPCPIVNVLALKALSLAPGWSDSPATRTGAEMLLSHWENKGERKIYMFGIGTDFGKLKYPSMWYDVLHVLEALSRLPFVHKDPRFQEMLASVTAQAGEDGRYTASSMYRAWQGWSFADKKKPSPWLTFLVLRMQRRLER